MASLVFDCSLTEFPLTVSSETIFGFPAKKLHSAWQSFGDNPFFSSVPAGFPTTSNLGRDLLPYLHMPDCCLSPVLPGGVSPTTYKQAELGSAISLTSLIDSGLPQLYCVTSLNYYRQTEFSMPEAAQEPSVIFLG